MVRVGGLAADLRRRPGVRPQHLDFHLDEYALFTALDIRSSIHAANSRLSASVKLSHTAFRSSISGRGGLVRLAISSSRIRMPCARLCLSKSLAYFVCLAIVSTSRRRPSIGVSHSFCIISLLLPVLRQSRLDAVLQLDVFGFIKPKPGYRVAVGKVQAFGFVSSRNPLAARVNFDDVPAVDRLIPDEVTPAA